MRFSIESDIENKLDILIGLNKLIIELQHKQLEANNNNTAILEQQADSYLRIDENIRTTKNPIERQQPDSAVKSGTVKNDYMYGMTFATKK